MQRNTKIAIFCLPTVFGYLIIQTLTILPWYTSILFALGEFYMMHHVRPSSIPLRLRAKDYRSDA